jgi:HAD superfamily hydrolase (TIGR01509 family)
MKNEQIIPELLEWTRDPAEIRRLSLRKEELFRESVGGQGIEPLPGVREFLARLDAAGIPRAVGSSTHRENIDAILARIGLGGFRALITAHDIAHGKPAPDVFLAAAAALVAEPRTCIVFEDAHVGIRAARAAGMKVVGVSTTHPADTLQDADLVVERLDELSIETLARLAGTAGPA